jgi:hypothetical protein
MAFLTQIKAKICKILILTLAFEKNANFFAENCQKSPKIVIITLAQVEPEIEAAAQLTAEDLTKLPSELMCRLKINSEDPRFESRPVNSLRPRAAYC